MVNSAQLSSPAPLQTPVQAWPLSCQHIPWHRGQKADVQRDGTCCRSLATTSRAGTHWDCRTRQGLERLRNDWGHTESGTQSKMKHLALLYYWHFYSVVFWQDRYCFMAVSLFLPWTELGQTFYLKCRTHVITKRSWAPPCRDRRDHNFLYSCHGVFIEALWILSHVMKTTNPLLNREESKTTHHRTLCRLCTSKATVNLFNL